MSEGAALQSDARSVRAVAAVRSLFSYSYLHDPVNLNTARRLSCYFSSDFFPSRLIFFMLHMAY